MIQEVRDQFQLLQSVHASIDAMVESLSEPELVRKPADNFNNIASIIEHLSLTEQRFLGGLTGGVTDIDIMAPFHSTEWNVEKIMNEWKASLEKIESALSNLTEGDLAEPGLKMRSGVEVNKRQVISYLILHAAHHRGQIPLIKKLLNV